MAPEFRLLGSIEARVDDQPLALGPHRQRCLLAALLVEANQPVTADQLVDRVWADRAPLRALPNVRTYLTRLRRALAPAGVVIGRRSGGYVCSLDALAVDLHYFQHLIAVARTADDEGDAERSLERALGLWRGEPFAGLDTPWFNAWRQRLEDERMTAELDHADLLLRHGRHADLLTNLAARAAGRPLDERLAGQYLLALYRSGRQADALEHYHRLARRLADELGAVPSPPLRELHQRILTSDATLLESGPAVPVPVPRQLPPAPAHFTGRDDELAALSAAMDDAAEAGGTAVILAIAGAGGIGKTWLALRWAHEHLGRFPDGQLFVDLRGFSPDGQPMPGEVAVRGFLDAFGVDPTQIPLEAPVQAARYRSLVADKRLLIVLDNAADASQVAPLLPSSSGVTVLVTSRNQLPGLVTAYGARHIPVGVLSDRDARALLTARLGAARVAAEPAAVEELLACCGGYPLALSIVAGRGHTHPHLPLATLATELREAGLSALDQDDPAASLPSVLSWSYRTLTAEQARVFGLLALAPGPDISLAAAVSLTGLPVVGTRTVLRALELASLLSQDSTGRYRMHDLLRRFATDHAPRDQLLPSLQRVIDFYVHTAYTGDQLLDRHRVPIHLDPPTPGSQSQPLPDFAAAMEWFETESANLMAAQRAAAEHRRHKAVWQLAWTLSTFRYRQGYLHDNLLACRTGLAAADQLDDPAARILARLQLGRACVLVGHHNEALDHLHQAVSLAENTENLFNLAHAHHMLAWAMTKGKQYSTALTHASKALDLFTAVGAPIWEASALNLAGWCAARLGNHEQARARCEAALALHRSHNDLDGIAATLDNLGYIAHNTGNPTLAISHYQQSLALHRELRNTYEIAAILDQLGYPLLAINQHHQARTAWKEALKLYQAQHRTTDIQRLQQQLHALDHVDGDEKAGAQSQ
jgi:DNA-binding SARP family transcriptional activator/Tfp pilus assembly protein PilF